MKNFISAVILLFCCVTISDAQTIPSYVPTTGLVGWWPFNGNANDESVNTNDGTVNGATLTTDRFGVANSAYYFSSASCLTRIDASINTSSIISGLTISVWILKSGDGCNNPRVLEFYSSGGIAPGQMDIGWDNSGIGNIGSVTSSGYIVSSGWTKPLNNVWTNLIYTNNGISGRFYQDGVLINTIGSPSIPTGGPVLSGNAAFGRMNHPAYDAFNGKLDDIGIWNRALTVCEIKKLYNSGTGLVLNASSDSICLGQSVILNASGSADYLWSNGATSSSITVTPTITSIYSVTSNYSVSPGCIETQTQTITITVNPCTGIDELENNQSIIFYPNPFTNEIYFKTKADILNKKYLIYNASGQLIQSGILNGNKINCSDFSIGLYFIKLEGSSKAFKLVKEN